MRAIGFLLVIFFLSFGLGCDRRESSGSAKVSADSMAVVRTQSFEMMGPNDVLVAVNGVCLDKKSVQRDMAIQLEIFQRSHPNARIAEIDRFKRKMLGNAEKRFIERQAMLSEATRRKITLTANDRALIRRTFANNVLRGKDSFEKLVKSLNPPMRDELESGLDKDMLCQKLNAVLQSECGGTVTDAELDLKFKNISEYNAGAKIDETKIWQNASNVWHRIIAGEAFNAVGESCAASNEHVRFEAEWGDFELDFFKGDDELRQYLSSMKTGSVTPPVTGDNGLVILKLIEILPVDFGSNRLSPRYRLGLIFFALPEYYPLSTKEQLRNELSSIKTQKELKRRIRAIIDGVKIEYPQGKCVMPGQ